MNLFLGSPSSDHVGIALRDAEGTEPWVQSDVSLSVGKFKAELEPWFEANDFAIFYSELSKLYESLSGTATLTGRREGQFTLEITGNGRGGMAVKGTAYAHATYGSQLSFEYSLDQTHLAPMLSSLSAFIQLTKASA